MKTVAMHSLNSIDRRRVLWGIAMWLVFSAVMIGVVLTSRQERTVMHAYRLGADRWITGQPLYDDTGHGFLYLPQAAVLFSPWAALPYWWSETLWRLVNTAVLAVGTALFCRAARPKDWPALFPGVSLATIALSWSAIRTGQMTVVMTGLMLISVADLIEKRWTRAAVWLWLAMALKPIVLPFLLLVAVLWPKRMAGRIFLGLLITAALPFACQRPDYVAAQYQSLPLMLRSAHDLGSQELYSHFFGMLEVLGGPVPHHSQTLVRGLAALAVLMLAVVMKRRLPAAEFGPFLGAVAASYILLFNPRTESNTYCLLGPFIGYYLAAQMHDRRWASAALLTLAVCLIVGNYEIGRHLFSGQGNIVLAPFVTILFSMWVFIDASRQSATAAVSIQLTEQFYS